MIRQFSVLCGTQHASRAACGTFGRATRLLALLAIVCAPLRASIVRPGLCADQIIHAKRIAGTVKENGHPLAFTRIELRASRTDLGVTRWGKETLQDGFTDSEGHFDFGEHAPGEYAIVLMAFNQRPCGPFEYWVVVRLAGKGAAFKLAPPAPDAADETVGVDFTEAY